MRRLGVNMATPAHRGVVLAARTLGARQAHSLVPATTPSSGPKGTRAKVDAIALSAPLATPSQVKTLKKIKKVREEEVTRLVHRLSLYGPMPAASSDAPKAMQLRNPFVAKKNVHSGKWRPPQYSLRRQADLAKQALRAGALEALPPGPKTTALKVRIERLKQSLPPSDLVRLQIATQRVVVPPPRDSPLGPYAHAKRRQQSLSVEVAELSQDIAANKVRMELSDSALEEDRLQEKVEAAQQELAVANEELKKMTDALPALKKAASAKFAQRRARYIKDENLLNTSVEWVGKLPEPKKGAELGIKLYANKRKMFKGHLWERARASRVKKQAILMRHMASRIARYKEYYKKRKPNPLKPSRYTKPPKLPF